MNIFKIKYVILFFIVLALGFLSINKGKKSCCSQLFAQDTQIAQTNNQTLDKNEGVVTFIELGSVKCIPCKMMQPVMEAIEKEYAGKVNVLFYDVWTKEGQPYGEQYGLKGIPTQIFLDKNGKEFYRHTGFLAKNQIVELLEKHGVKK